MQKCFFYILLKRGCPFTVKDLVKGGLKKEEAALMVDFRKKSWNTDSLNEAHVINSVFETLADHFEEFELWNTIGNV